MQVIFHPFIILRIISFETSTDKNILTFLHTFPWEEVQTVFIQIDLIFKVSFGSLITRLES